MASVYCFGFQSEYSQQLGGRALHVEVTAVAFDPKEGSAQPEPGGLVRLDVSAGRLWSTVRLTPADAQRLGEVLQHAARAARGVVDDGSERPTRPELPPPPSMPSVEQEAANLRDAKDI